MVPPDARQFPMPDGVESTRPCPLTVTASRGLNVAVHECAAFMVTFIVGESLLGQSPPQPVNSQVALSCVSVRVTTAIGS